MTPMAWHRPLMWLAAAMLATGVFAAVEYNVDDRILAGVPIWSKPLLFAISFAVYAVTLAWLISRLRRPRVARLARRAGTVIAVAMGLEMAAMVVQVVRGQRSHFNVDGAFNAAIFAGMGIAVGVIFAATVAVGIALLRESAVADRATMLAVRLGLGLTLAGMAVGFLMVAPRPSQQSGPVQGAHSVGVAGGGASLPVLGWSTTGGDLRIAHFVGLHALQALPLLALLLSALPVAARARTRLVAVGAAGYGGLFALLLVQALRGQPITAPDAWTVGAASGLVVLVAVAVGLVLRSGHRDDDALAPRGQHLLEGPRDAVLEPVLALERRLDVA